jgi:hypothetical protein
MVGSKDMAVILTGMIGTLIDNLIRTEGSLVPVGLKDESFDGEAVRLAAWCQHNRKMLYIGLVISEIPKKAINSGTIIP